MSSKLWKASEKLASSAGHLNKLKKIMTQKEGMEPYNNNILVETIRVILPFLF